MKRNNIESGKYYTLGEEIFNAVTHGVGVLLAVAALVLMTVISAKYGNALCIVSSVIYGVSLIVMYTASTFYHALTNKTAKKVFRILDHGAIFLLIAGTYTPYTLIAMNNLTGFILFGIIWTMAILGITVNSIDLKKYAIMSVVCYVLMGWAIVFAIKPLIAVLSGTGLALLVAGGIVYTAGIAFYAFGSKVRYFHPVWHLFVLAGSMLHYFSIFLYVLPWR